MIMIQDLLFRTGCETAIILLRNLAIRQMDTLAGINLSEVSAFPGGDI